MTRKQFAAKATSGLMLLGACALVSSAGDLNPPPGAISPSMVTLSDLNAAVSSGGGAHSACPLPLQTYPTEIAMSYAPISVGPIQGDDVIGPAVNVSRVLDYKTTVRREASTPSVSEIVVTKQMDSASPKLMLACASGEHLSEVIIDFYRIDPGSPATRYMEFKMTNVLVSSYQVGGAGAHASGDTVPTEEIAFNFEEIKVTYVPSGESTSVNGATGAVSWNPGGGPTQ